MPLFKVTTLQPVWERAVFIVEAEDESEAENLNQIVETWEPSCSDSIIDGIDSEVEIEPYDEADLEQPVEQPPEQSVEIWHFWNPASTGEDMFFPAKNAALSYMRACTGNEHLPIGKLWAGDSKVIEYAFPNDEVRCIEPLIIERSSKGLCDLLDTFVKR